MQINIVLVVVALLLLGGSIKGFQHGMVKELSTLIGLIGALAAGAIVVAALRNYQSKNTMNAVIAIMCLIVVLLAYKVIDFILTSLKMLSKIPIIHGADKLLGAVAGLGEAVIVVWIAFLLITAFDIAGIREPVLNNISENVFLTYLFYNNYIARGIAQLSSIKEVFLEIL